MLHAASGQKSCSEGENGRRAPLIALVLPSFGGGGAQRAMLNLAEVFTRRGYRVDVVVARSEGPLVRNVVDGVRVVDLKAGRLRFAMVPLLHYLWREKPAAVMPTMTSTSIVTVLACRMSRIEARVVIRHASILGSRRRRRLMVRAFYRLANRIIAQSDGMAANLVESGGVGRGSVITIPNYIPISSIQAQATMPVTDRRFNPDELPLVVAVGRFSKSKGFDMLLHAFAMLRSRLPCRLVILGDGEERTNLEEQVTELAIGPYVWMPGFVQNPFRYVARSAVFVLSSRVEAFGNVVVEALAVGTPVVATDVAGGVAEILGHGKWGSLVRPDDPAGLACEVERVVRERPYEKLRLIARAERYADLSIVDTYMRTLGLS